MAHDTTLTESHPRCGDTNSLPYDPEFFGSGAI